MYIVTHTCTCIHIHDALYKYMYVQFIHTHKMSPYSNSNYCLCGVQLTCTPIIIKITVV